MIIIHQTSTSDEYTTIRNLSTHFIPNSVIVGSIAADIQ